MIHYFPSSTTELLAGLVSEGLVLSGKHQPNQDSWFVKRVKDLEDNLSSIIILIGTLGLTLTGILRGGENASWIVQEFTGRLFLFSAIISLLGTVTTWKEKIGSNRLRQRALQAEKDLSVYREAYTKFVPDEIKTLYQSLQLGRTERVSILLYQEGENNFLLIHRYSIDAFYSRTGRKIYPENEGVEGRVLRGRTFFYQDLPDPASDEYDYYRLMRLEFNLPEETAKQRTMQSRCCAGFGLYDFDNNFIAAIVFESEDPKGLDFQKLQDIMNNGESLRLTKLLKRVKTSLEPDPSYALKEEY